MMLEVAGLEAFYGEQQALFGVGFELDEGGVRTLLGAKGAGKTTVLRALCGMVRTAGEVRFDGKAIAGWATEDIVRLSIAHVPEGRGTFLRVTVEENLQLGAMTRRDRAGIAADIDRVYDHFPLLRERRDQQAGTLSGGEQQMLAVGRALMLRPRLMLLDEPSFGLAPLVVAELFEILRQINREVGVAMLVVEQNAALALDLADHAYLLETGRIVMDAPAAVFGGVCDRRRAVVRRRRRDRARAVQADPQRTDPEQHRRIYRAVLDPEQRRRLPLRLHDQGISDPVRQQAVPWHHPDQHPPGRHDRRDLGDARAALPILPRHPARLSDAGGGGQSGIGPACRHPGRLDDCARLGDGGGDRRGCWCVDRAGGVSRAEHDARRAALRLCRRRARRFDQPRRRRFRWVRNGRHRKPRRHLHPVCRPRAEIDDRVGADRRGADGAAERHLRPTPGGPGMTVPTEEIAAKEPVAVAPPVGAARRGAVLDVALARPVVIAASLVIALVIPLVVRSFIAFQLTQVMIYALAILGLNLLTGYNGQFSLGHSAFYGIGAYTAAIMMP